MDEGDIHRSTNDKQINNLFILNSPKKMKHLYAS